jgi:hypothetical protein
VFEAVKGQIERMLKNDIDACVIFDGTLQNAIDRHFGGRLPSNSSKVVFIGFSDAASDTQGGSGLPIREGLLVDVYVIVRSGANAKYEVDRQALWDISDVLVHDAFEFTNRHADLKACVASTVYQGRRRQETTSDVMAHLVRFVMHPQRQLN